MPAVSQTVKTACVIYRRPIYFRVVTGRVVFVGAARHAAYAVFMYIIAYYASICRIAVRILINVGMPLLRHLAPLSLRNKAYIHIVFNGKVFFFVCAESNFRHIQLAAINRILYLYCICGKMIVSAAEFRFAWVYYFTEVSTLVKCAASDISNGAWYCH